MYSCKCVSINLLYYLLAHRPVNVEDTLRKTTEMVWACGMRGWQ